MSEPDRGDDLSTLWVYGMSDIAQSYVFEMKRLRFGWVFVCICVTIVLQNKHRELLMD